MVPTFSQPYGLGDLRIGIASWDQGDFKSRSIKYAYRDKSGKVSRGCPERVRRAGRDGGRGAEAKGSVDRSTG
jgi:hypothetical protein